MDLPVRRGAHVVTWTPFCKTGRPSRTFEKLWQRATGIADSGSGKPVAVEVNGWLAVKSYPLVYRGSSSGPLRVVALNLAQGVGQGHARGQATVLPDGVGRRRAS
jgi:hypothetical protein